MNLKRKSLGKLFRILAVGAAIHGNVHAISAGTYEAVALKDALQKEIKKNDDAFEKLSLLNARSIKRLTDLIKRARADFLKQILAELSPRALAQEKRKTGARTNMRVNAGNAAREKLAHVDKELASFVSLLDVIQSEAQSRGDLPSQLRYLAQIQKFLEKVKGMKDDKVVNEGLSGVGVDVGDFESAGEESYMEAFVQLQAMRSRMSARQIQVVRKAIEDGPFSWGQKRKLRKMFS